MITETVFPKFPYVHFKSMKKMSSGDDVNGTLVSTDWFLNLSGCHNQIGKINDYIKQKNFRVIGHGNLQKSKFNDVRNFVDSITNKNVDPRLLDDAPTPALQNKVSKALKEKQANES